MVELTFLDHPLKSFPLVFDAVLVIGTIRGKQPHDVIATVGVHVTEQAGREVHCFTDTEFMLSQLGSPGLQTFRSYSAVPPPTRWTV
jgi:hypothetical protein